MMEPSELMSAPLVTLFGLLAVWPHLNFIWMKMTRPRKSSNMILMLKEEADSLLTLEQEIVGFKIDEPPLAQVTWGCYSLVGLGDKSDVGRLAIA